MNKLFLAFIIIAGLCFATSGNYTVEKQITALHSGNNSGNSSNYTTEFVMPWNPANASGTNYSAVISVEILGWYFPIPPDLTNMTLLAAFLGLQKNVQTTTSIYTTLTVPLLAGFDLKTIVSIIFLLLGLALLLIYTLKYWKTHK
jgi:hypothetical protein